MSVKRVAPTTIGWIDTFLYIIQIVPIICALAVLHIVMWPLSSKNREALKESRWMME